ncbi:MAG TPA: hypothetical protein DCQ26_02555 [Marinilabiliales bacterium]|jgi:AcrR family transcriptional regulator|nr:MAG: hypothetical protein A2W95_09310 [Bacteroidetes bacterium GWA2_40_14]OFZ28123.1 MAG: hypothetical protein A2437_04445 [Bacteroidetes bacterium RIFOXYC2_FULL_40_12]HAM97469.1 hypothetical protein [Marinilabiliales bacterium]HAZ00734.1 hypothetical protein [Marinilabiliales bacterium]HBO73824.1 hypothetical protein [Marinilabiliales bacterium]
MRKNGDEYLQTMTKIEIAAQQVFLQYGFHGTTLAQIAALAQVNKTSIHYYFRSKEKLYAKVLENVYKFILLDDFADKLRQQEANRVKWFLTTEIYNNEKVFVNTIQKLFPDDFESRLYYISKWLEVISVYSGCT